MSNKSKGIFEIYIAEYSKNNTPLYSTRRICEQEMRELLYDISDNIIWYEDTELTVIGNCSLPGMVVYNCIKELGGIYIVNNVLNCAGSFNSLYPIA